MAWFKRADPSAFLPQAGQQQQQTQQPQYVPVEQFNAALDQVRELGSKFDQFTGMVAGMVSGAPGAQQQPAQQPRQAEPETPIPDITDDEYNDAVLRGDAAKLAIRTSAITARAVRDVEKRLGAQITQLQSQGMGILDQVNTELGQQALSGMPYYQLLKSDIDAQLKDVPAHQRTPQMRQWIYERTVGANLDKITAYNKTEEARLAQEREQLTPPGRARQGSHDDTPTAASVFGEDILKPGATWHGGGRAWEKRSPDEYAKRRYGVADMNQAAVYATNIMAVDDCPECFMPVVSGKCSARCARLKGAA